MGSRENISVMGDVLRRVVTGEPADLVPGVWAAEVAHICCPEPGWKSGVRTGSSGAAEVTLMRARSVEDNDMLVEVSICDTPESRTVELRVGEGSDGAPGRPSESALALAQDLLGQVARLLVVDDYRRAALSGAELTAEALSPNRIADYLSWPGSSIAVVVEGRRDGQRAAACLSEELRGIGLVARMSPSSASELVDLLGVGRVSIADGGVLALARADLEIDAEAVPSFSVMRQPDSVASRVRRSALKAQSSVRLGGREAAAIAEVDASAVASDSDLWGELAQDLDVHNQELRHRVEELELLLDLAYLEQSELAQDNDDLGREVVFLRGRLRGLGEYSVVLDEDELEPDIVVASCEDALIAAHELGNLWVGAPEQPVQMLDRDGKRTVWGKKAWQSFKALNRYAAAKASGDFTGNLLSFCDDEWGANLPSTWVALNESDSTGENPRTRSVREFTVPPAVSSVGTVYMEAHIKLGMRDSQAPRIHFYDDTGGPSGRMLVGYFGPHLETGG